MNERPIGVFDSGLGGLTALRRLKYLCPNEKIIYFGDTGRVPYGTKSAQIIRRYALQDARFLDSFGVKAILVACGTVSANAMDELKEVYGDGVMGVIDATVNKAAELTEKGGNVLILGTEATIESGAYEKKLTKLRPDINIMKKACPMFVPMVENGFTSPDNEAVKFIVSDYLGEFASYTQLTVILGCTHYPLLSEAIAKVLFSAKLVDSGLAAAEQMKDYLDKNALSAGDAKGEISLYVSDGVRNFDRMATAFMNEPTANAKKINIEEY